MTWRNASNIAFGLAALAPSKRMMPLASSPRVPEMKNPLRGQFEPAVLGKVVLVDDEHAGRLVAMPLMQIEKGRAAAGCVVQRRQQHDQVLRRDDEIVGHRHRCNGHGPRFDEFAC